MTYFFKLFIYDKTDWSERASFIRHHGLYSTLELAVEALKEDILHDDKRLSPHQFMMPMLPRTVVEGTAIWERILFFDHDWTSYYIHCFKLIA
jgi:hypothetical protein